ncbi:DUF6377 domain-containing protein [Pedobacter gandavensis]|uniref:DUF6377 domain-containing protein n=1 Tax=Pedobacter gandavensis TaxID=2679963 RepID=UPI00247878FC|nr:DUF6377 domain-containing protein [Pedobacter gandavensis]WGQ10396.1 DUF6377 domain-containing protein [Pedobacter gandavensis]
MKLPKKTVLLLFLFTAGFSRSMAASADSLLKALDHAIQNRQFYTDRREATISQLKQQLKSIGSSIGAADLTTASDRLSKEKLYQLNSKLYQAYKPYQSDSAIRYANHNLAIARVLNNPQQVAESKLQLSELYAIAGMSMDAARILSSLRADQLSLDLKIGYYQAYKDLYSNLADYRNVNSGLYRQYNAAYRDSLLQILHPSSRNYLGVYAEKLSTLGKYREAEKILLNLLSGLKTKNHEYAIWSSALGNVYKKEVNTLLQQKYFALSAISDLENAIKENTSLQALAISLYETGDLDRAYSYIKYSMEDAIFCNAPLRTIVISKIFPIIDAAHQAKEKEQRTQLVSLLVLISVLSAGLVAAIVYVFQQLKKLEKSRLELQEVNGLLKQLNKDLQLVNQQLKGANSKLMEANRIKEQYIGNFLDLCSNYINKLEDYRKGLNKKASTGNLDVLFKTLKSTELMTTELKALYKNFDDTFLHLYPDFVIAFNNLLVEEERFELKPGELNTELRIFALLRLGIHDSAKIAAFLRCSMSTIYNYRTKVRNKALVPREDFENYVIEIGTISTF